MKKVLLSSLVVVSFVGYIIRQHFHFDDDEGKVVAPVNLNFNSSPSTSTNTNTSLDNSNVASSSPPPRNTNTVTTPLPKLAAPVNTAVPVQTGKYKNGSYIGSVADAFYGNIQVKAVISGGKLTNVIFLQYPNDRGNSIEINSQAMPYLKQEAIQAQSANVNGVSGATASSGAFIQSLGDALAQAAV